MSDERPVGRTFSHVYLERGPATDDSATMRRRLGEYASVLSYAERQAVATELRCETGDPVYSHTLRQHFVECSVPKLLDSITHVFYALGGAEQSRAARLWRHFVGRTLAEENVSYVVDSKGGVHPAADEEFDRARRATVAGLNQPRYSAALQSFENGMACLKEPRNTRDAVTGVFDALETVVKLMFPEISRLGAKEIEKFLKPLALRELRGAEREATKLMLNEFADWVNACHQYRHAQAVEEPDPPSLGLAIWMVSTGAAHLRWLIELDQARKPVPSARAPPYPNE